MIELKDIQKRYANDSIIKHLNLQCNSGKTLGILGKSGSGKTTLLKIVAGIESLDDGVICINKQDVTKLESSKREALYIYQEALLFPHLSVYKNISFGLEIKKETKSIINDKVEEMITLLELNGHENKLPKQLSGGQKQRVAFGRALVMEPKVLLLDEPFGALDSETRAKMQNLYQKVVKQKAITSLFVTHDLKEAITVGDQLAMMQSGQLKQYDGLKEFGNDLETGYQNELNFWKNLEG